MKNVSQENLIGYWEKQPCCYCYVTSVVSDSVRPHPWDSPGKNTGVGCHFLLQRIKEKSESEVAQSCLTLLDPMDCSLPGSSVHGIFQARVLEWGAIAFSEISSILKHHLFKTFCYFTYHPQNAFDHFQCIFCILKDVGLLEKDFQHISFFLYAHKNEVNKINWLRYLLKVLHSDSQLFNYF